ncbi:unnamed protein product, partial [Ectocarpus fasciculatus]
RRRRCGPHCTRGPIQASTRHKAEGRAAPLGSSCLRRRQPRARPRARPAPFLRSGACLRQGRQQRQVAFHKTQQGIVAGGVSEAASCEMGGRSIALGCVSSTTLQG